jgi:hypothetical protein
MTCFKDENVRDQKTSEANFAENLYEVHKIYNDIYRHLRNLKIFNTTCFDHTGPSSDFFYQICYITAFLFMLIQTFI